MIVKIEIDLGEEYPEYDEDGVSIGQSIQQAIKHRIVQEMLSRIRKDSFDKIGTMAENAIIEQKESVIKEVIADVIQNKKVKKQYSGDQMISYAEYIEEHLSREWLQDSKVRNYLDDLVKNLSTKFSTELKQRYDILFASQIVTRLNEQGMLKDEVAKILLGDGK